MRKKNCSSWVHYENTANDYDPDVFCSDTEYVGRELNTTQEVWFVEVPRALIRQSKRCDKLITLYLYIGIYRSGVNDRCAFRLSNVIDWMGLTNQTQNRDALWQALEYLAEAGYVEFDRSLQPKDLIFVKFIRRADNERYCTVFADEILKIRKWCKRGAAPGNVSLRLHHVINVFSYLRFMIPRYDQNGVDNKAECLTNFYTEISDVLGCSWQKVSAAVKILSYELKFFAVRPCRVRYYNNQGLPCWRTMRTAFVNTYKRNTRDKVVIAAGRDYVLVELEKKDTEIAKELMYENYEKNLTATEAETNDFADVGWNSWERLDERR